MKWHSEWWGIVLVPETQEEVDMLDGVPENPETTYEGGTANWEEDPVKLAEILRTSLDNISLPMGKALVLDR